MSRCTRVAKNFGCPEAPAVQGSKQSTCRYRAKHLLQCEQCKLAAAATASLNKIVKVMNDNPELKKIEGNTDNVEKDADKLSEDLQL
jgi:hypothetical protein